VIAQNGKCTHIVNGVVVNEGTEASLRSGRILIQSEGAEIYYRKSKSGHWRLLQGQQPALLCPMFYRVKEWPSMIFCMQVMGYT